ncbi:MAG: hypothetical protein R2941_22225 [Desulfobacterales bacterium]
MIPDMREIRELADGGIVRSGEYFKISMESGHPVRLTVLLSDSSGKITLLAEAGGRENPLPFLTGRPDFS